MQAILISFFLAATAYPADRQITFIMGGDVTWTLVPRLETVLFGEGEKKDPEWPPVPHYNDSVKVEAKYHGEYPTQYNLKFASKEEECRYPLQRLAPTLRGADVVFLNLETPLSDTARRVGLFRTPTQFADALHWAGTSVVTIANNHTFDAEERGFLDTINALDAAHVGHIGGGRNLQEARSPLIIQKNGLKIGFLGYAQFSNAGEPAFAGADLPGMAPMDPVLMKEDIRKLRNKVDYVAVSIHWGSDASSAVSPKNRELAHQLVDAGADLVLGHHPPHPKGIEIYHGKAIVYSPSHVFSGHNYSFWEDNYLARFTLTAGKIAKIEVLPIAGTGQQMAQPFLLEGSAAAKLLEKVRALTAGLDTKMEIHENIGVIIPK